MALNSVEQFRKGKLNGGVVPFDLFSDLGGDPSEAFKDKATSATRPLPQDRQRPSPASKKNACTTGCAGLTGREDRANDRCLTFAGRQTVSSPTRDSSVVFLDPSQEQTKALPRHLSVHKTPLESLRKDPEQRRDLLAIPFRSSSEIASGGNPTGGKSPTDRPRYTRKDVPGATEPESKLGAAIQSSAAPGTL